MKLIKIISLLLLLSFLTNQVEAFSSQIVYNYDEIQALLSSPPYLWAGTTGGLIRYELTTGRRLILTTLNGLPSMNIISLSTKRDGGFYVGTLGEGLAIVNPEGRVLKKIDHLEGISDTIITSILEVGNTLYVGTSSGIYYYSKRSFLRLEEFPTIQVNCIKQKGDSLYLATQLGLYEIPLKTRKPKKIEITAFKGGILCLEATPSHLYLGTNQGVIRLKTETLETVFLGVKEGLPVSYITSLRIDGNKIYIGTSKGLRVANENLNLLSLQLPLEVRDSPITSIEVSSEYVFVGTNRGIVRMLKSELTKRTTFGVFTPLYSNRINVVIKEKNNVYLGTSKGLSLYNEDFDYLRELIPTVEITGLGILGSDLFVASNSGFYRFNLPQQRVTETYTVRNGLFHNQVFDLKISDGEIYLATRLGVQIYDPLKRKFESYFLKDVLSLCIKGEVIYAGTLRGLYSKRKEEAEFLKVGGVFSPNTTIRNITFSANSLYLTTPEGLIEFREDKETFNYLSIFPSATIYSLLVENHNFYLASDKGFLVWNSLNNYLYGLTNLDGLPSNSVISFCKDADKLYLGTTNGLLITPLSLGSKAVFYDTTLHYLRRALEEAFALGIVHGFPDKSFRPDEVTTKAQFSVMLLKTLGITPQMSKTSSFADVPSSHWASPFIEELVKRGVITKGGNFRPNSEIKREEAAEWIVKLKKFPLIRPSIPTFRDVPTTSPWYEYVETSYAEEIFVGTPKGNFLPKFPLSRAEAVAILKRLISERF